MQIGTITSVLRSVGMAGLLGLLCMSTALAASGSSGEGGIGEGCETETPLQLVPPRYRGTLIVRYDGVATVSMFTLPQGIKQFGAGSCTFTIDPTGPGFELLNDFTGSLEDFQNTPTAALVNTCRILSELEEFFSPGCANPNATFLLVTHATNKRLTAENEFLVDVMLVQMALKQ
jgi:hypothetical protein